jgi:Branched-chain amino acid transport protein (AzlD)
MTGIWLTVVVLALATAVLKLAGPLLLGGRPLSRAAMSVIELLASALLAALLVVETFGKARSLVLNPVAAGVAFAAFALAMRRSMTVAVIGAAVVTAVVRALT